MLRYIKTIKNSKLFKELVSSFSMGITITSKKEGSEPPDKEEKITLGATEEVFIDGKRFRAKVDTGADKSSIGKSLLKKLKFYEERGSIRVRSASGRSIRKKIKLRILIRGKKLVVYFSVADRRKLKYDILIGKNILKRGFIVDVTK